MGVVAGKHVECIAGHCNWHDHTSLCAAAGSAMEAAQHGGCITRGSVCQELIMPVGDKCGSNMDMTEVVRQNDCLAAELGMQRTEK